MALIRERAASGSFILLPHAIARGFERSVAVADIAHALINGWHEATKDEFKDEHRTWNYTVRGSTIDRHQLRIVDLSDEAKHYFNRAKTYVREWDEYYPKVQRKLEQ